VIPQSFSDKLPDISGAGYGRAPYLLPSIKSFTVEGNGPICSFKVKLYPYLNGKDVTKDEIEGFREKIAEYGLAINKFDDKPLNFKRLPDKYNTITAIDSDMLYVKDRELFDNSKEFLDVWIKHVKAVFPVYYSKEIVHQADKKDFSLSPLFANKYSHLLALNSEQKAIESRGAWLSKLGF
jgi:hypothetical protein